jgi:hypothetical protein
MATKASGAGGATYGVGRDRKLAVAKIAEATVKILKASHDSGLIKLNDRSRKLRVPELAISIDAPRYLIRDPISRTKHLARILHSDSIAAPFELNISTSDEKMLNAVYYGSFVDIESFRRGHWEDVVLSAAERAPIRLVVQSHIPMTNSPMAEYSDQFCIVISEEFWGRLRNTVWFQRTLLKHHRD